MTIQHPRPVYNDEFRQSLLQSHAMTVRGELWYDGALVDTLDIVSGSVSADRAGSVRRTAEVVIDPTRFLADPAFRERTQPYGARVKLWRGVRYADGRVEETQVFTGRVEAREDTLDPGLVLRCADEAAQVMDSRFVKPTYASSYDLKVLNVIPKLITEVLPATTVWVDGPLIADHSLTPVRKGIAWETERGDALDQLCTQVDAQWSADARGEFHIEQLPGKRPPPESIDWAVDAGESGVMVRRTHALDRQNLYNAAVVYGEAIGGVTEAYGYAEINDPADPLRFGGPFGKVPRFYTGQQVQSTDAANTLAQTLVNDAKATMGAVTVECVVNPRLNLEQVIRVYDGLGLVDGLYYVQSMTIPLDPESPMTAVCYQSLAEVGGRVGPVPRLVPSDSDWRPEFPR